MTSPSTPPSSTGRRGSGWTDDRIREELRSFLADRTEWPTYREFERSGLKALRDAATPAGGARRWARRMDVRSCRASAGYALSGTPSDRQAFGQRVELEVQGLLPRRSLFCSSATSSVVTTPEYVPTTKCHVSTLLNVNRLSAPATTLATDAQKKALACKC